MNRTIAPIIMARFPPQKRDFLLLHTAGTTTYLTLPFWIPVLA